MQHTRRLLTGLLTLVPGGRRITEGSPNELQSARYCYWVWLRHLTLARNSGLRTQFDTVVEIGCGASLGVGLAALLTGSRHYYALDVVTYTAPEENLKVLDELVELFEARAPIPEGEYAPAILPPASRDFPSDVLDDDRLAAGMAAGRIAAIRRALLEPGTDQDGITIEYQPSWTALKRPADLVLSQAVMEHIPDFPGAYASMHDALAPGGVVSHHIDFRSHHFARDWNGHWTFGDTEWRIVKGRRLYAINRAPLHEHLAALTAAGLRLVGVHRVTDASNLQRADLMPRFQRMPDEDLVTGDALIQAVKD